MATITVTDYESLPDATTNFGVLAYVSASSGEGELYKHRGFYKSDGYAWNASNRIGGEIDKDLNQVKDDKVDKISGKGLSQEDFTTTLKSKLDGITPLATVNDTDANLKARANHTGSQLASTISDFATQVDARIALVVGAAPASMDTLVELANAIANDPNYATTMATALSGKVDKVTGKGLSQEDFTTTLKGKLDALPTNSSLTSTLSAITGRLDALEAWSGKMAKQTHKYTGTTDVNGDITITYPTGRYSTTPVVDASFLFNNNNHGCCFNIKAQSSSSVTLRIFRTINVTIGALGGEVTVTQALPSTAVVITATEY